MCIDLREYNIVLKLNLLVYSTQYYDFSYCKVLISGWNGFVLIIIIIKTFSFKNESTLW